MSHCAIYKPVIQACDRKKHASAAGARTAGPRKAQGSDLARLCHKDYFLSDQVTLSGASVASVAMNHGINANVVHKWFQFYGTL